jgi:hypothetical protein
MYCPGLSGEGSGSMGRGLSGSGKLGRSNRGRHCGVFSPFSGFSSTKTLLFRVEKITYSIREIVRNKP